MGCFFRCHCFLVDVFVDRVVVMVLLARHRRQFLLLLCRKSCFRHGAIIAFALPIPMRLHQLPIAVHLRDGQPLPITVHLPKWSMSLLDGPPFSSYKSTTFHDRLPLREKFEIVCTAFCILHSDQLFLESFACVIVLLRHVCKIDTSLCISGLGMIQPCGHVDFYVNGGHDQPGCEQGPIVSLVQHGLLDGNCTRGF